MFINQEKLQLSERTPNRRKAKIELKLSPELKIQKLTGNPRHHNQISRSLLNNHIQGCHDSPCFPPRPSSSRGRGREPLTGK